MFLVPSSSPGTSIKAAGRASPGQSVILETATVLRPPSGVRAALPFKSCLAILLR